MSDLKFQYADVCVVRSHEKSLKSTYRPQFLTFSKKNFAKIYDLVTPPYQVGVNRIKRNFVRFHILTHGRLRWPFSWKNMKFDLLTPIFYLFQNFFHHNLWLGHTPIPSRSEQNQKKFCQILCYLQLFYRAVLVVAPHGGVHILCYFIKQNLPYNVHRVLLKRTRGKFGSHRHNARTSRGHSPW